MGTFGEEIRQARKRLKLKQKQVCDEVTSFIKNNTSDKKKKGKQLKLKQVTLSAWELGRQVPDVEWRSVVLEALEKVLQLKIDYMTTLIQEYEDTSRLPGVYVMDEERYLREIDRLVDNHRDKLSLWFIGPHSLPVLKSEKIRARWIDNIGRGVKYNVLWFLDQIPGNRFNELIAVMREIEMDIEAEQREEELGISREQQGSINHYATVLFPSEHDLKDKSTGDPNSKNDLDDIDIWGQPNSAVEEYKKLIENIKSHKEKWLYNKFSPLLLKIPDWLKNGLQLYWQSFGSLVLFKPDDNSTPSVSLSLEDVRNSTDGDSLSLFVFLNLEHAFALKSLMESVVRGFQHGGGSMLS